MAELEAELEQARAARAQADELAEQARASLQTAEREVQDRRREAARVGGELAVANQFLRSHAAVGGGDATVGSPAGAAKALSEELSVRDGYELALAAALGGRLSAVLVRDVAGAQTLLDRAGPDGGSALLAELASGRVRGDGEEAEQRRGPAVDMEQHEPPAPGAERLLRARERAGGGDGAGAATARRRVGGRALGGPAQGLRRNRRDAHGTRVVRAPGARCAS